MKLKALQKEIMQVGINKAYFPKEMWPGLPGESFVQIIKVKATSRPEAAKKVWKKHGKAWLSLMNPHVGKLPRKVSLDVDSPRAGTGGLLGRLTSIGVL